MFALLTAILLPVHANLAIELSEKVWTHGAEDCASSPGPAIDTYQFDAATFILRQSKCVHFEAPFIYVLFGEHTALVLDTGATEDAARFPLRDTVERLVAQRGELKSAAPLRVMVVHSHSHGDHTAGDTQFRGRPGVTIVEPNARAVRKHFGFDAWPAGLATVDLGAREVVVLPIPGHQNEGIALYDSKTGWLLTGDNLYPGRLYVNDWTAFRSSVARLAEFSKTHRVSAVLGAHIEMSSTGRLFPSGSTYQPGEAALALKVEDLLQLAERLRQAGATPQAITMAQFVVVPIGPVERVLTRIMKWVSRP